MRPSLLIASLFFYLPLILSQNLIPNPSFEEYNQCPTTIFLADLGQGLSVVDWFSPTSSSDYYNNCAIITFDVPTNHNGYQEARTGNAYVGLAWAGPLSFPENVSEYIEVGLINSLEKDSNYIIEFYTALAEDSDFALRGLEVVFTDSALYADFEFIGNPNPTIIRPVDLLCNNCPYQTDTANWQLNKWIYTAKGGEQFITIGNFQASSEVDFIDVNTDPLASGAYYYIDDVRVEKIPYHIGSLVQADTIICEPVFAITLGGSIYHQDFLWSTGDTTATIVATTPGIYTVQAYHEDCLIFDTIEISYVTPESFSLGMDISVCEAELPYLIDAPDNMDSYLWNDGSMNDSLWITQSGQYSIIGTYVCGDINTSIDILVIYPPLLDIGADTTFCDSPQIDYMLSADAEFDTYLWNTTAQSSDIQVLSTGIYAVTATYACGEIVDSINLIHQPLLSFALGEDTSYCFNEPLEVGTTILFDEYIWNTGEVTATIAVEDYGSYILEASNVCQTLTDTIEIITPPAFILDITENISITLGETATIDGIVQQGIIDSLYWTPDLPINCSTCLTTEWVPTTSQTYLLTITDNYNCTYQYPVNIAVDAERNVYIPNAFSPNADGVNDYLGIYTDSSVANILSFEVFDRWGGKVFSQSSFLPNNPQNGWNGYHRNQIVDNGIYTWQTTIQYIDGLVEVKSGNVIVMK